METWGHGGKRREVILEVGREYIVDPINPRAKRNRGRRCELLGFVESKDGKRTKAKVTYLDNRRVGRVELHNLAEAEPSGG